MKRRSEQRVCEGKGLSISPPLQLQGREPPMDRRARSSHTQHSTAYLCPEAVAIGDGPLGARGSSQVLISITTLSRD